MAKKIKLNDNNKVVEEDKSKKRAIIIALSCALLLIIGVILVLLLLPKNIEDNTLDDDLGQTYQITINDGEHGQITTASANAFENCINLANFDINGIISEIEQFAFSGCFNLKTFIFRQPNPPFVNQNTFANFNDLENKLTVQL